MITSYILTSELFRGAVQFNYNAGGLLVFYNMEADLTEKMLIALLQKIPREEADLAALTQSGKLIVKKVTEDLSFENFWRTYDKKIHPHRCEPIWKKLSDIKKVAALKSIAPYDAYCSKTGVAKANPENYLKREYYKTDWKKETV